MQFLCETRQQIENRGTYEFACNIWLTEILHSDQGRNFESAILQQTLDAFGINKSRTTTYDPQGTV